MKMILAGALVMFLGGVSLAGDGHTPKPHTTRFTSPTGRPQGKAVTQGNVTRFYNQSGRPQGRAVTHGKVTQYTNQSGRPTGKSTR